MKKRLCFVLPSLLLAMFLLSACTPQWIMKVTDIVDVKWSCDDPSIEIQILKENPGNAIGFIEFDGVKKEVFFTWGFAQFYFYLVDEYEWINDGQFVGGGFRPKDDTHVQLKITTDDLFDGKLVGKKLILTATKINNAEVDAKFRSKVKWHSITPEISFYVPEGTRTRAYGEIDKNGVKHNIAFFWQDDGKFEIFSVNDNVLSALPIMKGTYESEHLKAILTIMYDDMYNFAYSKIELTATEILVND